jgi:hypothetical protein
MTSYIYYYMKLKNDQKSKKVAMFTQMVNINHLINMVFSSKTKKSGVISSDNQFFTFLHFGY